MRSTIVPLRSATLCRVTGPGPGAARAGASYGALQCQGWKAPEFRCRKQFAGPAAAPILSFMDAMEAGSVGSLEARARQAIEAWWARNGMSTRAVGAAAMRDRDFVLSLRRARSPRLRTVDLPLAAMGDPRTADSGYHRKERASLGIPKAGNPCYFYDAVGLSVGRNDKGRGAWGWIKPNS